MSFDQKQSIGTGGFGILEFLIAAAIISGSLIALAGASQIAFRVVNDGVNRYDASLIAEEGLEVVRLLRDESWSENIDPALYDIAYFPTFNASSTTWMLASDDPGLIDNRFKRIVVFDEVYRRDIDDDIIDEESADQKTLDTGTRKVTSRVLWESTGEIAFSFEEGATDADLANFPSDNSGDGDPAQSVTIPAGDSVMLHSVELFLKRASGATPSDVFLEVRSGGTIGEVVATSEMVNAETLSDEALLWVTFSFSGSVSLQDGTQYFLRLRSNPDSTIPFSGSSGTLHWGYQQADPSPYSGGEAYRYVGRNDDPDDGGQLLGQYDFSFRINEQVLGAKQVEIETYITDIFDN